MVKASALIDWCKKHVGDGYVYGSIGQVCTQELLDRCNRSYGSLMGPDYYTVKAKKWLGKWVSDCSGLFKAARKALEGIWADVSAQGTYDQCKERGTITSIPRTPGTFVFTYGKTGGVSRMVHVGMYIGDGKVIEARGVNYGIVITNLKERNWTHWGKASWVEFDLPTEHVGYTPVFGTNVEADSGDASTPKPDDVPAIGVTVDATAAAAHADGAITSPEYWTNVLAGKVAPNPEYVRKLMDNYHGLLAGRKS